MGTASAVLKKDKIGDRFHPPVIPDHLKTKEERLGWIDEQLEAAKSEQASSMWLKSLYELRTQELYAK